MKTILTCLLLIFICLQASAQTLINSECVYLDELLGGSYPHSAVQCGFQPGDAKSIPASLVDASLKRLNLVSPDMPASFAVKRSGSLLDEAVLMYEIQSLYEQAHPEMEIDVESIRLGRNIFLSDDSRYTLDINTDKFGSANGVIKVGQVKYSLTYTVRAYAEVYVLTERVAKGAELAGAAQQERMDVSTLKGFPVDSLDNVISSKVLQKGRILTTDMVETRPDRFKGDPILLIYKSGEILLEIMVIAESNAIEGKNMLVKNPTSGKIFQAKYVGNGKAIVE